MITVSQILCQFSIFVQLIIFPLLYLFRDSFYPLSFLSEAYVHFMYIVSHLQGIFFCLDLSYCESLIISNQKIFEKDLHSLKRHRVLAENAESVSSTEKPSQTASLFPKMNRNLKSIITCYPVFSETSGTGLVVDYTRSHRSAGVNLNVARTPPYLCTMTRFRHTLWKLLWLWFNKTFEAIQRNRDHSQISHSQLSRSL